MSIVPEILNNFSDHCKVEKWERERERAGDRLENWMVKVDPKVNGYIPWFLSFLLAWQTGIPRVLNK